MQTLQACNPPDSQLTAAGLVEHDVFNRPGWTCGLSIPPRSPASPYSPGLLLPLNLLELRAGQLKGVGQQPLFLRRVFLRVPLSLAALLLLSRAALAMSSAVCRWVDRCRRSQLGMRYRLDA